MMAATPDCELCREDGGELLWRDEFLRIVLVPEPQYPGFCRVVLNRHVAEMTDLDISERHRLMNAVYAVEEALRRCMTPDKINLASLGNMVPHLHWHIIPRFRTDAHFPAPIWATPMRPASAARALDTQGIAARIATLLAE